LILLDTHIVIWWATGALERERSRRHEARMEMQDEVGEAGGLPLGRGAGAHLLAHRGDWRILAHGSKAKIFFRSSFMEMTTRPCFFACLPVAGVVTGREVGLKGDAVALPRGSRGEGGRVEQAHAKVGEAGLGLVGADESPRGARPCRTPAQAPCSAENIWRSCWSVPPFFGADARPCAGPGPNSHGVPRQSAVESPGRAMQRNEPDLQGGE